MIKAVLFDFGQTLVDSAEGFRAAEKQAQTRIFDDLALTSWQDFIAIYRRIRNDCQLRSNFSRKECWQEVYWYYCRAGDVRLLEEWEHDYWATVKAATTIFPEAQQVLQSLAGRYRLALVSNTQGQNNSEKHRLAEYPQLAGLFDAIIIAGESGIPAKPAPAPFTMCLKKLDVTPAEAVYVGDDWHVDICGARGAGVQPIWLKHHLVERTWPKADVSVPVIASLAALLDIETLV